MITKKGAWFYGGYKFGMKGTLGVSLDSDTDNLGWAIRSWKYELAYNNFGDGMVFDTPVFGDAARARVRDAQTAWGLVADGVIGPRTGERLMRARIASAATVARVPPDHVYGIVAHESSFDLGAIGYVDTADRGATQKHIYPSASVDLSQAIRPGWSIPNLANHLAQTATFLGGDKIAAIAAWNIGDGGAEWWHANGRPATGSPNWWPGQEDMSVRATAYVDAIQAAQVPRLDL